MFKSNPRSRIMSWIVKKFNRTTKRPPRWGRRERFDANKLSFKRLKGIFIRSSWINSKMAWKYIA
jgi:hypothetical protein